jgi:hypothetical protein
MNKQKKRVNNNGLLDKVKELEKKILNLEKKNFVPQKINYDNKIKFLENKVKELEKKIKYIKPGKSSKEDTQLLKDIINTDLNKLKIKIEKNESIIKKILFN